MATETGTSSTAGGVEAVPAQRKPQLDTSKAEWLSAKQGDGSPGDVQIAFVEGYTVMRDGRFPDGPVLVFTPEEWRAFVLGAQDGEFDLT
ncbi:DUF397 domain-containing protein [Kitasatospora viridis]|uniref:Uncharacterized protein DUF397 n=1 Tax=Kitasatospora viridis TaxID=281105 RepID=A0A561UP33_9ACTN|nr:uncharacterized protein DUF397 [Kitasatospora viridis]